MESSDNPDEMKPMEPQPTAPATEAANMAAPEAAAAEAPHPEGRRTQLKIVRERIDSLTNDVSSLRRVHLANHKKLEGDIAKLRKDFGLHAHSKDVINRIERHDSDSRKKLEKEVAALHQELAAMRKSMEKEAAKSRAREEAAFSKVLAKVKPKAKAKAAKRSKKK